MFEYDVCACAFASCRGVEQQSTQIRRPAQITNLQSNAIRHVTLSDMHESHVQAIGLEHGCQCTPVPCLSSVVS